MFPVGEAQIFKMNKIPFLIEFWNAVDNEFLGVIKVPLAQIHKGFIFEGKLNEMAIKTSILPTVIHKGTVSITTLADQRTGECYFAAHIGTTSQIQSYISAPRSFPQQFAQPTSDVEEKPAPEERERRPPGTLSDLTALLSAIDSHEKPSLLSLQLFKNNHRASREEF
jgi:hypothetical protein